MTTAPSVRRPALVESVRYVLHCPSILRPLSLSLADPTLRMLRWTSAQLRFHLVSEDGVPDRLIIPRQVFSIAPPQWLARQFIPITHDLIPHPSGPRRRHWFRCPACERRCSLLYLPDGEDRFACRVCLGVVHRSWRDRLHTAVPSLEATLSGLTAPRRRTASFVGLTARLRWIEEGKGRHRRWRGEGRGYRAA